MQAYNRTEAIIDQETVFRQKQLTIPYIDKILQENRPKMTLQ